MSSDQDRQKIAVAWYWRYREMQLKFALIAGALALSLAMVLWLMKTMFSIAPGKGTPISWSVRTEGHVATLVQTLEPYIPSLNRDHGKNTYTISLFIVPLDGSRPRLVPISGGHRANSLGLARVLGGDGANIWFEVNGTGAVALDSFRLLQGQALADGPPDKLQGAIVHRLNPQIEASLSSGFFVDDEQWFGVISVDEAQGEYAPRKWLRRVTHAESAKRMRRFHRGSVGDKLDASRRIVSMQAIDDAEYLNAAFLRQNRESEPFRLSDPDSAVMIHTSEPDLQGRLIVSRVSTEGRILWQVDSGMDRFSLSQILPGPEATVFVGSRPPVPDKLSEPLLVIVEHASGKTTTHTLWR